jgi:two-component system NtrC family response regulator
MAFLRRPPMLEIIQVDTGVFSMTDQRLKVLVVDDDERSRELFCEILTSAGYVVRAASDGLNAISHMEASRFDVVLTDFSMPGMDGLDLLVEIGNRWPESRVVVPSNMLSRRVSRLARLEGAYASLSKPRKAAQLLKTIAAASSAA